MIGAVVLSATLAFAAPSDDVQDAVARAEAHYLAKEYEEASWAFGEAYSIDPNPIYLYARAQAERLAGRCVVALALYDKYLASKPPKDAEKEARINRARCGVLVAEPPPPAPDAERPPEDTTPPPRPWYRDPLGASLVGVGGVTTVIGAGLLGIAISNDRDAPAAASEGDFLEAKDSARARYRAGIALVSIGAVAMVAGAIRWALVAKQTPREQTIAFGPAGVRIRF